MAVARATTYHGAPALCISLSLDVRYKSKHSSALRRIRNRYLFLHPRVGSARHHLHPARPVEGKRSRDLILGCFRRILLSGAIERGPS